MTSDVLKMLTKAFVDCCENNAAEVSKGKRDVLCHVNAYLSPHDSAQLWNTLLGGTFVHVANMLLVYDRLCNSVLWKV